MVGLLKVTAVVAVPAQTVWLAITFTVADGFTVIVKVIGAPVQFAFDGVAVIVAVSGAPVAFAAVNCGIFPVPLAARPMAGFEFVQFTVMPGEAPNTVGGTDAPLQ